jgi:hypothetical protein
MSEQRPFNFIKLATIVILALFLQAPTPSWAAPASKSVAASKTTVDEVLPPVLPPDQFFSMAQMAYSAAKSCPTVCAHLFCYCGCDLTDNHSRLLDCFTSTHGVDCHICQEEALMALRMSKNGDKIADIQKAIDEEYSSRYPYQQPSPALKKYLATRLWHSANVAQGQAPADLGTNPNPEAGKCCAKDSKPSK